MEGKGWDANKKLSMSLFGMIPLGFGEIFGGFILGFIMDRWKQKAGLTYCIRSISVLLHLPYNRVVFGSQERLLHLLHMCSSLFIPLDGGDVHVQVQSQEQ